MGEIIGQAVGGTLYFIAKEQFDKMQAFNGGTVEERTAVFADMCRLNTLYMIARAGSGHIGSSFSSLDIVSHLYLNEMQGNDIYFSSKGHDAPGLYSLLIALGKMSYDKLDGLRRLGGLPGHPDVSVDGMAINGGSLGQGISKAKGMVRSDRLAGRKRRIYVLTGDGELQEGQIWESLVSGANDKFGEITVIVDHNKLQSDYLVSQTSDLGDLEAKFHSFGWHVERCDGHDLNALSACLENCTAQQDQPQVIIADTIKGQGVSFMEHTAMESDAEQYRFHSGAPDADSYRNAAQELIERINKGLGKIDAGELTLESVDKPEGIAPPEMQKMIPAYTEAVLDQAAKNNKLVTLDADLILDTGLIPFRDKYPDRFFECGISEQDMVSQAGGLALQDHLPLVHSFACFLGPRANEQIYTNATEGTKIIYVGSLAGVLPGGPGHSHQSVRDISALAGMPNTILCEPCCEAEVSVLLDHLVNKTDKSSYMRLVSIPCEIPYELPSNYQVAEGKGTVLREGSDGLIIAYGPVMLPEAFKAADQLQADKGLSIKIAMLPWLNTIDNYWIDEIVEGMPFVVTLDNHYLKGGQGEMIACAIAELDLDEPPRTLRIGLNEVPVSGTNDEVLGHHKLDAASIATKIGNFASS